MTDEIIQPVRHLRVGGLPEARLGANRMSDTHAATMTCGPGTIN
jgi:hypothetical protein